LRTRSSFISFLCLKIESWRPSSCNSKFLNRLSQLQCSLDILHSSTFLHSLSVSKLLILKSKSRSANRDFETCPKILTTLIEAFSRSLCKKTKDNVDEKGFKMDSKVIFPLLQTDAHPSHIQVHHVGRGRGSNGERANLHLEKNWL